MLRAALCLVVSVGLWERAARAEDELSVNPVLDGMVIGVGGVGWILSSLYQSKLAPSVCDWCDRRPNGMDDLNSLDRAVRDALRWSNTDAANLTSGVVGFVVAPAAALGLGALAA